MQASTRKRRRADGFTLIELIVVITIIGILATTVVVNFLPRAEEAKFSRVKVDMNSIDQAVGMFKLDYNRNPESLEELMNPPVGNDGRTRSRYLKENPIDPWGTEYEYYSESGRIYVTSYGPDQQQGTEDDITNDDSGEGGDSIEGFLDPQLR